MKELERIIISSCFGEDQYRKVSFLEPEDFTNYPGKPYREFFKMIEKTKADSETFINCLQACNDLRLKKLLFEHSSILGYNNPDRYALKLLEIRFETLFANLLSKLSSESKKAVESEVLNEALFKLVKPETDVFDLSDHLLEYLGVHASDRTKNRITSFLEYRDKRAKEAKQVIKNLN